MVYHDEENYKRHVAKVLKRDESDAEVSDIVANNYDNGINLQENVAIFDERHGTQSYNQIKNEPHIHGQSKREESYWRERQEMAGEQFEEKEFKEKAEQRAKERYIPEELPGEARVRPSKFESKSGYQTEEEALLNAESEIKPEKKNLIQVAINKYDEIKSSHEKSQAYARKKKIEELKAKAEVENEKAYIKRLEREAQTGSNLIDRLKGEGETSPFKSAIHGREKKPFWMRGSDTGSSGIMAAVQRGEPARYLTEGRAGMSPLLTGQRQPAQRGQYQTVIAYDPVLRRRVARRVYVGEQQPNGYYQQNPGGYERPQPNSAFMSAVLSGPRQEQRQYEPRQHKSMLQDAMFGGHGQNLPKEHRSALMSAITQPKSIYESEHESPLRKAMEGKKGFKL